MIGSLKFLKYQLEGLRMTCWMKRLDIAALEKRVGVTLSGREMQAAARTFEDEVGHDALAAMSPERLGLVFAGFLRKWVKRNLRHNP